MDPFGEFLRRETGKVKARKIGSTTFIIEEQRRDRRYNLPTDFLDLLLLRGEPSEHVFVEKGVIREMRYRLDELENEVKRLRWKSRILEVSLVASLIMLILSFLH